MNLWKKDMEICDLILFAGQSNMAGRGITSERWPQEAPELTDGAGYEYRAITEPDRLSPIEEPFGVDENNPDGIFEPGMKTGSMVTAFVNEYYKRTHMPVLAVSASKGGSAISEWQGNNDYLSDAIERFQKAMAYAQKNHIHIRHKYVLWCQGETDGDRSTDMEDYGRMFINMFSQMKEAGIEKCFLVTIGEYNGGLGYEKNYVNIRKKQLDIVKSTQDIVLVCDEFHKMKARGLMKDDFHYYQHAYNEVGTMAGNEAGKFVMNSLETRKNGTE